MRKIEQFNLDWGSVSPVKKETRQAMRKLYEWISAVVSALIIILLIFTFLIRIVGVSGSSMEPTLKDGNVLAITTLKFNIKRGDIVVVKPTKQDEPLIKRVIAVAGDTVDINFADGSVSVNGQILNEPYIAAPTNRSFDLAFPLKVPEGCVFVMGDNRNHSFDSRSSAVGFIDEREILGVVRFRIFPIGKWSVNYVKK